MGRNARRKGKAASCKGYGRRGGKTKTKTKDLDQIKEEIVDTDKLLESLDANSEEKVSHLYCVTCARFFQSEEILTKHIGSKIHKHRLRKLKEWPEEYGN